MHNDPLTPPSHRPPPTHTHVHKHSKNHTNVQTPPAGFVLIAVSFYAFLALGGPASGAWSDSRLAAALVVGLLLLPYACLLWWISAVRCCLEEMVGFRAF